MQEEIPAQRPWIGVHVLIIRDGRVLLIHRQTQDMMHDMYAMPAGRVDEFEAITVAGCRELEEETGLGIVPDQLELMGVFHRPKVMYKGKDQDIIEFVFMAKDVVGNPQNMEPDKHSEVGFFPLDALPKTTSQSTRLAVETYLAGGKRYLEVNAEQDNAVIFEQLSSSYKAAS